MSRSTLDDMIRGDSDWGGGRWCSELALGLADLHPIPAIIIERCDLGTDFFDSLVVLCLDCFALCLSAFPILSLY